MAGVRGIFVVQSGKTLVFQASLKDDTGTAVTSGTINLRLYEVQSDGTLLGYSFSGGDANTFVTNPSDPSDAMTHQQVNSVNSGIWTSILSTVTGFTSGNRYIAQIRDDSGTPTTAPVWQEYAWQYGSVDGDPVWMADIVWNRQSSGSGDDEYTATWFKDGVRVTSGITTPLIQVIKRADGTDLVASTAMTQIGTTGSYKYDETTNKVGTGEAAIVVVTATIDGAARSWSRLVVRDS